MPSPQKKAVANRKGGMERLAMWLQIMGAISFTIGCAFEKPDNSLQSQLRRAIEKEDLRTGGGLRDKIKRNEPPTIFHRPYRQNDIQASLEQRFYDKGFKVLDKSHAKILTTLKNSALILD